MENTSKMSELMQVIDTVLEKIVWVNADADVVSLKSLLHMPKADGTPRSVDDLTRQELTGAYTCLQIRHELFGDRIQDLSNQDLSSKIKDIVFSETQAILSAKSAGQDAAQKVA